MEGAPSESRAAWIELFDSALHDVYGYLLRRCGNPSLAQDLTSETMLAAARSARERQPAAVPTTAWLMAVARNKLVDHWRRAAVEERSLRVVAAQAPPTEAPWDVDLDGGLALEVLGSLATQHRAVLTLRYLDGLSTTETAELLGRTAAATQALLARARAEFRRRYEAAEEATRRG